MDTTSPPPPDTWRWVAAIAAAIVALDVRRLRRGEESWSEFCRRHRARTLLAGGALVAHLCGWPAAAARFDPLSAAARRLRKEQQ